MPDIPECLSRRYQALDELVTELTSVISKQSPNEESLNDSTDEAGVKLMCDFWNILKEDPDCNLTQAVKQRLGLNTNSSRNFNPQKLECYMASKHDCSKNKKETKKNEGKSCCSSKSLSAKSTNESVALSKVLCNLQEAVSKDKRCNDRISDLMEAQAQLTQQIQELEDREKEGTQLLKEADCMWACMEEAYKKKVADCLENQNVLIKQMKEIDASNTKWRKNRKELEFQMVNVNKCNQEIKEKIHEKTNDIKCIKMEIENFKKRLDNFKNEIAAVKKSFDNKKNSSNAKIVGFTTEISRIKSKVQEEVNLKRMKEQDGSIYVKDAREDLQKIYRVLLQKKLENEDLRGEKEAILQELEILKKTTEQCKEKCQNKQQTIVDEIAKLDAEITGFKARCIQCHQCIDTSDVRKFCTDCQRCAEERECLYEDGHCIHDATTDCVCMSTKQKFMNNVFDNMYTILERQAKSPPGKAVAEAVLNCLRKSRNGKLNGETKKILQDFVLTTVKKNLNLTIIGGAVKTRCEMDPESYQQLMLCLKDVKIIPPTKEDKGTVPKKTPCRRWGGTNECNCPKGPQSCICTKQPPPQSNESESSPQDKNKTNKAKTCLQLESESRGADCSVHAARSAVGTDVAARKPATCDDKHGSIFKSMRAAQCMLGPDSLSRTTKGYTEDIPKVSVLEKQIVCNCGSTSTQPCACQKEIKCHPRERIIEEVMGRYTDVRPIEKVSYANLSDESVKKDRRKFY